MVAKRSSQARLEILALAACASKSAVGGGGNGHQWEPDKTFKGTEPISTQRNDIQGTHPRHDGFTLMALSTVDSKKFWIYLQILTSHATSGFHHKSELSNCST